MLQQLTKGPHDNPLPDSSSQEELANKFADFFTSKIKKIRSQFQHWNLYTPHLQSCTNLTCIIQISEEETPEIPNSMKKKTCDIDPCDINFLMEFKEKPAEYMDKDNQHITVKWLLSPTLEKSFC